MDHDVDEEWELIPTTSSPRHSISISMPFFLPPNFYDIQPDYFTCPAATPPPPPPTLHHRNQHQQPQDEEGHHDDIDHDAIPPTPAELFKDIPISTEFTTKDTTHPDPDPEPDPEPEPEPTPVPVPLPAATSPPFNWLEPDSLVFDRGPDLTSYDMPSDKDLVADRKDCPGFNLWSLGLNGIGAICSFGVATAATLCIFALGAASGSGGHLRPSPNIQFQIYSHDKRIKEVVQRATGVNHAISGSHGPGITNIARAQISFGGHYDHYEGL